jgi:hypothetical protein
LRIIRTVARISVAILFVRLFFLSHFHSKRFLKTKCKRLENQTTRYGGLRLNESAKMLSLDAWRILRTVVMLEEESRELHYI